MRQAVVLVHGIGDQPPMWSLRTFTWGLGLRRLFSSPDRVTDSLELRRLTQPPEAGREAYTDFFELYWAHLAPDGAWFSTAVWSVRLAFRRAWWGRRGWLARLVVALQVAIVVGLALLVWAVGASVLDRGWSGAYAAVGRWQAWAAALLALLGVPLGWFLRTVVSDAVRYLQPSPANIESRRAIREEGLDLLRRLHTSGEYERVVVAGHSLGSVIAYDLLNALWDDLRHPDPRLPGRQDATHAFDAAADRVDGSGREPAGGVNPIDPIDPIDVADVDAFQRAQHDLWLENRSLGGPWLVTDFVTFGSPLTYAAMLLSEPAEGLGGRPGLTFVQRQALKEFPRCPPIRDELEEGRFYTRHYLVDGGVVPRRVGHTAGAFGPTRWTNLYQRPAWVLRGDPIGGPLSDVMGPGVRDVPVVVAGAGGWAVLRRLFPFSHAGYTFSPGGGPERPPDPIVLPGPDDPPAPSPSAVVTALRLDDHPGRP